MGKVWILSLLLGAVLVAQDFEYIGTNKCKMCHNSTKKGKQFERWSETTHAKAFETLLSDQAIAYAKERGIETLPHQSPECLECHTVGFGSGGYEIKDEDFWNPAEDDKVGKKAAKRMENLKNVGCEACHGPGSKYKGKKTMEAIYRGETDRATVGLATITEETCLRCHNERSPSFKPFDFEERKQQIAHPYPPEMGVKE